MSPKPEYGNWSLTATGAALLLIQLFQPLLLLPVQAVGTATWLALLLAGCLAIALYLPAAYVLGRLAGGDLIDLARAAAGTLGEILTGVVVCALITIHAGFVLREVSEMALSSMYPHTPQTFAVVALTVASLYGAWGGFASLVRLCRVFLPVVAVAILLSLAGSFGWGELRYLLPFWGYGPATTLSGAIPLVSLYAPAAVFMLAAAGRVHDRQHLVRAGAVAMGSAAIMVTITAAIFLMTFPLPLGDSVTFPLHEMTRLVVGGRFFERLDGIWMYIWVFGNICYLATALQAAGFCYTRAFRCDSPRPAILPLGAIMVTIAFFPPDQGQTLIWHGALLSYLAALGFGMPLVWAALAWWRQWRAGP